MRPDQPERPNKMLELNSRNAQEKMAKKPSLIAAMPLDGLVG
jgi:hypothetical protein